jgi:hypothetical protein
MFTIDLIFKLRKNYYAIIKNEKELMRRITKRKNTKWMGPSRATIPILILLQATNVARQRHQKKKL